MQKILCVGEIVNTHGVRGELKIVPLVNNVEDFKSYKFVFIDNVSYDIETFRLHKDFILIKLKGIDDKTVADKYKGKFLELPRELLKPLSKGIYYICDLIGLKIIDETIGEIGTVEDLISTGSNEAYVTTYQGKPLCIPILEGVVKDINLDEGTIRLIIPKGLI